MVDGYNTISSVAVLYKLACEWEQASLLLYQRCAAQEPGDEEMEQQWNFRYIRLFDQDEKWFKLIPGIHLLISRLFQAYRLRPSPSLARM